MQSAGTLDPNLLLLLTRVGQWSRKIEEDVRTWETPGGMSGGGKISLWGAMARGII